MPIDASKVVWDKEEAIDPAKVVWDKEPGVRTVPGRVVEPKELEVEEPSFVKDVALQTAKDVAGVVAKVGAGLYKGITVGAVDIEKGILTTPIIGTKARIAPPLGKALVGIGVSPEIAESPWIGIPGEFLGVVLPWSMASRLVGTGINYLRALRVGKNIAKIAEPAARTRAVERTLGQAAARIGQQAITGGLIGAAHVREEDESLVKNIVTLAAAGAVLQTFGEGINVIATSTGLSRYGAYRRLKKDLTDLLYKNRKEPLTKGEVEDVADFMINKAARNAGVEKLTRKDFNQLRKRAKDVSSKIEKARAARGEPEVTPTPEEAAAQAGMQKEQFLKRIAADIADPAHPLTPAEVAFMGKSPQVQALGITQEELNAVALGAKGEEIATSVTEDMAISQDRALEAVREEVPEPVVEVEPTIEERITAIEEVAKVEKEVIRKEFEAKKAKLEKVPVKEVEEVPTVKEIDKAAKEAETEPTEAQKEAGTYKKGHIKLYGLDISIENPKGSMRTGVDRKGREWSIELKHHYGYIRETKGKDKDHLDVFIGSKPESDKVFVVDQIVPDTGKFDEHKIMMGFETEKEARAGYLANYEKGWKGLGEITELTVDDFKEWTKGDTTKAIGEIAKPEIKPPVEEKPTAVFKGWQEQAPPKPYLALYNVIGGRLDKSTVAAKTLEKEGIAIPETPEPPKIPPPKAEIKPPVKEKVEEPVEPRPIVAPLAKEGKAANVLIKTKDGTIYESEKTHALMIDEFDRIKPIEINEIDSLGVRINIDRVVWRNVNLKAFKIQLRDIRRAEPEVIEEVVPKKVAKPIPEVKEPKEAWEMSKKEYTEASLGKTWKKGMVVTKEWHKATDKKHKQAIQQAIKEGKITSHPDYPELGKVEKPTPPEPKVEEVPEIEVKAKLAETKAQAKRLKFAAQQQKNLINIGQLVPQWLKRAGADEEVLKNITIELKPFIDLRGKKVDKTLQDWEKEGIGIGKVLGATTFDHYHALIQLATNRQRLAELERSTYHEWYHIAKAWMLPQSDINALRKHFKTEESEADTFAAYMKNAKTIQDKPGLIKRLFLKLKRMLTIIRNGLKGMGFKRPEDIFGKIRVRAYKPIRGAKPVTAVGLTPELKLAMEKRFFQAVAIRGKSGKIYEGTPGEIHMDVMDRIPLKEKEGMIYEDSGFIDQEGKFYTRPKAVEAVNVWVSKMTVSETKLAMEKKPPPISKEEKLAEEYIQKALGKVKGKAQKIISEKPNLQKKIAQAHIIAQKKGWISKKGKPKPQYRKYAEAMTGKRSVAKMNLQEIETFIDALKKVPNVQYVAGKLKIASIPQTKKITPAGFFERNFKEPTIIQFLTPSDRYAYTLGVHDLIEPSIQAKTAMLNARKELFDWLDDVGEEINRLQGTTFLEKRTARLKNRPTKAEQRMWNLLDKHETVETTGLTGEEGDIFSELRRLTGIMLKRVNKIREQVGLDPINKLSAYITHISDTLSRKELEKKYPFPEEIKYWLNWINTKHIYNPTALKRMVETRPGLLKNPIRAMKAMVSMDLKQIYLENPNLLFREQLNALGPFMPSSTRHWVEAYMKEVIKGYPTKLDNLTNATLNALGITKTIDLLLKPFGRTVGHNPIKDMTGQLGRIIHDAVIWGKIRLVLRNHTQKLLSLGLYDTKAFIKSLFPASKELKGIIDESTFFTISKTQFMERLPEGIFGKLEKIGFKPYGHSHISNVNNTMKVAYYAAKELVENPKYKNLGWTDKDVKKEMEFGAHTCQYWYNLMGMPTIYRSGITRLVGTLQSWWMNYTTNYWREMLSRAYYGKTGWGKPIPLKWRIGALRHIVTSILFIEGLRRAFDLDYSRIALLGVLPTYLSPPGQILIGLTNLILADAEWKRKKAIRQLKYSWKAFIPGSGAWRDFTRVWNKEIGLKGLLFYVGKPEKETNVYY